MLVINAETGKRGQSRYSIEANAVYKRLLQVEPGESIAYEELTQLINLDTRRDEGRRIVLLARSWLLRERIRFDCIRGFGLRRMTDSEVARSGVRGVQRVRRTARREKHKLAAITNFEALPNDEKVAQNASMAMLGALEQFAKPSALKSMEENVAKGLAPVSLVATLEMFTEKKGT